MQFANPTEYVLDAIASRPASDEAFLWRRAAGWNDR